MPFPALFLRISVYLVDVKDAGLNESLYSYSVQMWPMFQTVTAFFGVSEQSLRQCRQPLDVACDFSIIDT